MVMLALAAISCNRVNVDTTVHSPTPPPTPSRDPTYSPRKVDQGSLLIEQVREFFANYEVDGFIDWMVLESAADIPAGDKVLKHPRDYQDVVRPPQVSLESGKYLVVLYTWTGDMGMLAHWELTVENGILTYLYGQVVDVLVGDVTRVRTEGPFLPTPNKVITDEIKNVPLP
jgi:hypothetical protein